MIFLVYKKYNTAERDVDYSEMEMRDINFGGLERRTREVVGGILVEEGRIQCIFEVQRIAPRIMKIKMMRGDEFQAVSGYMLLQIGRPQEEKLEFWEILNYRLGRLISVKDFLMIVKNLNGHWAHRDGEMGF